MMETRISLIIEILTFQFVHGTSATTHVLRVFIISEETLKRHSLNKCDSGALLAGPLEVLFRHRGHNFSDFVAQNARLFAQNARFLTARSIRWH